MRVGLKKLIWYFITLFSLIKIHKASHRSILSSNLFKIIHEWTIYHETWRK